MNHPHEPQAAAMARAGELTDGEQLRECINSGQVSAAQVVAHAENGDFKPRLPKPAISTPFLSELKRVNQGDYYSAEQVHALINAYNNLYLTALAAERAEVARFREALEEIAFSGMSPSPEMSQSGVEAWHARQAWRFIGIAARALNPTQGATNHD